MLWLCLVGVLAYGPNNAQGTTVRDPSFAEMVEEADAILQGEVVEVSVYAEDYRGRAVIRTKVSLRIETSLGKAVEGEQLELRFLGGELNGRALHVDGMPKFREGERVILFVKGNYRAVCPLVGWSNGRFKILRDEDSGVDYVARNNGETVRAFAGIAPALSANGTVVAQANDRTSLAEFTAAIAREQQRKARDE
jgi:hypothetical protein